MILAMMRGDEQAERNERADQRGTGSLAAVLGLNRALTRPTAFRLDDGWVPGRCAGLVSLVEVNRTRMRGERVGLGSSESWGRKCCDTGETRWTLDSCHCEVWEGRKERKAKEGREEFFSRLMQTDGEPFALSRTSYQGTEYRVLCAALASTSFCH